LYFIYWETGLVTATFIVLAFIFCEILGAWAGLAQPAIIYCYKKMGASDEPTPREEEMLNLILIQQKSIDMNSQAIKNINSRVFPQEAPRSKTQIN